MTRIRFRRALLAATAALLSGSTLLAMAAAVEPTTDTTPATPVPTTAPAIMPASDAVPADPLPPVLAPYVASYAVSRDGKPLGEASLQLLRTEQGQWRYNLDIQATRGLFGLAGLEARQSTVFDVNGRQFRPLSQRNVREAFFFDKTSIGRFDWANKTAQWGGDISEHRQQPVPLHPGDLTSLLVNLAVVRDASPGTTLHYRIADNGRSRQHSYAAAPEKESITANGIGYRALRVTAGDGETVFWIAEGVPTPIRILKRDDGEELYDLTLIEYH